MRWTVHLEGGPRRVNHAAVCIGDKIYSFGGYSSVEEYINWDPIPVHVLDTTSLRWQRVQFHEHNDMDMVPFQRYGHTAVAYKEKVYMWGGRNNDVASSTLSCFDINTLEWTTPAVFGMAPLAKDGHSACVIGNKMYLFGGFQYSTDQYSQDIHCLNLDNFEWTLVEAKGTPPSHRDFHTAVAVGNRMYIYGGRGDLNSPYNSQEEMYCPQVFYFDTVEEKWVTLTPNGSWPEGRRSHSAWLHEGEMYIFGGYNGNTCTHFNDLYAYSIKDNSWRYLDVKGYVPSKRRRQACINYNNKVYLFGGTSPCVHDNIQCETSDDNSEEKLLDNSDLHILDYAPTLKTLSILSVLEHNLDQSLLPRDIVIDIRTITIPNRITRPISQSG